MKRVHWLAGIFFVASTSLVYANPTRSGSTGLVKAPTAETLDSGNICVGVWCDASANKTENPLILPVSLTMGIGTFWEIYGSYPNVLFNNQEEVSGDGTVQLGMKFRLGLKRNAPSQFAIDTFFRRHLSLDSTIDGVSDFGGRLIYSRHDEQFGGHIYSGYIRNGQPNALPNTPPAIIENEVLFGGGLEYMLNQRSKLTLEATGNTSRSDGSEIQLEGLVGYQYYLSPHLTFNLAAGRGLIDSVTDWRVIVGFSTCQGIGTYIKPIPQLVKEREAKKTDVVRPTKVIPLSPLMVKTPAPQAVSKLEVPLDPDQEEVIVKPFGQVAVAPQLTTSPVVLPRNINLELPGAPAEKAIVEPASSVASGIENKAMEYTLARMSGSTPLYGVIYQEDKLTADSVTALSPPEAMTVYRKFRFPDIIFEAGSIALSKEVVKSLSEVAEIVRKDNRWRYLRIDGHTDNVGSTKYNMELSLRRAIAVANHLITREGLDPAKVFVKGLGKSKPIADNGTADGRAQNRRFEILFLVNK